ncbi:hypothetical protein DFS33DRAFT_1270210 [Desarmillaria ectypa]|nr:hypothetical protein DFS33DRAFT_1270210 [Desarmillaria ectypa]
MQPVYLILFFALVASITGTPIPSEEGSEEVFCVFKSIHNDTVATPEHFSHCLQYLQQTLLYGTSNMLKRGDFLKHDLTVDKSDLVALCLGTGFSLDVEWREFQGWKMSSANSG